MNFVARLFARAFFVAGLSVTMAFVNESQPQPEGANITGENALRIGQASLYPALVEHLSEAAKSIPDFECGRNVHQIIRYHVLRALHLAGSAN